MSGEPTPVYAFYELLEFAGNKLLLLSGDIIPLNQASRKVFSYPLYRHKCIYIREFCLILKNGIVWSIGI